MPQRKLDQFSNLRQLALAAPDVVVADLVQALVVVALCKKIGHPPTHSNMFKNFTHEKKGLHSIQQHKNERQTIDTKIQQHTRNNNKKKLETRRALNTNTDNTVNVRKRDPWTGVVVVGPRLVLPSDYNATAVMIRST